MKGKLIIFAIIFAGSFAMHYFLFRRDNGIGEMLFISAVPAAIIALASNQLKLLGVHLLHKIFKQKRGA